MHSVQFVEKTGRKWDSPKYTAPPLLQTFQDYQLGRGVNMRGSQREYLRDTGTGEGENSAKGAQLWRHMLDGVEEATAFVHGQIFPISNSVIDQRCHRLAVDVFLARKANL